MSSWSGERGFETWIRSKLEEPWTSDKVSSLLTNDVLTEACSCWSVLESSIKLRLLFSFISTRKSLLKELEGSIRNIFTLAKKDEEEWVRVVCEMLEPLIDENSVNLDLTNKNFQNGVDDLKQKLQSKIKFYPLDFAYLNQDLLPDFKEEENIHFTLKKPIERPQFSKKLSSTKTNDDPKQDLRASKEALYRPKPDASPLASPFTNRSLSKSVEGMKPFGRSPLTKKTMRVIELDEVRNLMKKGTDPDEAEIEKEKLRRKQQKAELEQQKKIEKEEKKRKRQEDIQRREAEKERTKKQGGTKRKSAALRESAEDGEIVQPPTPTKKQAPMDRLVTAAANLASPRGYADPNTPYALPGNQPFGMGIPQYNLPNVDTNTASNTNFPSMISQTSSFNLNPGLNLTAQPSFLTFKPAPAPIPSSSSLSFNSSFPSSFNSSLNATSFPSTPSAFNTNASFLPQSSFNSQAPFSSSFPSNYQSSLPSLSQQANLLPPRPQDPSTSAQVSKVIENTSLFDATNQLRDEEKELLLQFLSGDRRNPTPEQGPIKQILLNEEKKVHPSGGFYLEQIIFEMNYEQGTWKKLRRKKACTD